MAIYAHMLILREASALDESVSARDTNSIPGCANCMGADEHADWPIRRISGFWGSFWESKVP